MNIIKALIYLQYGGKEALRYIIISHEAKCSLVLLFLIKEKKENILPNQIHISSIHGYQLREKKHFMGRISNQLTNHYDNNWAHLRLLCLGLNFESTKAKLFGSTTVYLIVNVYEQLLTHLYWTISDFIMQ